MIVNIKRQIDAPSNALWAYLGDFANIQRFHPLLKGSEFIEGSQSCEVGTTRQCDMKNGTYVKERVLEWVDGSHYTIEVYETDMPMKNATASLGVKSLGGNQTEAYMRMEFEPKNKLMGAMMFLMFRFSAGPGILKGLEDLYRKENAVALA